MNPRVATAAPALAVCRESIATHSKSFALASTLFAPHTRDCAAVVYAWCRRADDAIDAAGPEKQADALLRLRRELEAVYRTQTLSDPVLSAFRDVVQACAIPRLYPEELLAGMEMDALGTRYATLRQLHRYSYCVASTVGLMMSHVMGVRDDAALRNAAHMGLAMQITNICRDVLEDWQMGRLYIPHELLAACGAGDLERSLGGPFPEWARGPVASCLRALLAEAERFYVSGDRGLHALPWRCAVAVRAARLVYSAIGGEIARKNFDIGAGRAIVPGGKKVALSAAAVILGFAELPARAQSGWRGLPSPHVPQSVVEFPDGVLPV